MLCEGFCLGLLGRGSGFCPVLGSFLVGFRAQMGSVLKFRV